MLLYIQQLKAGMLPILWPVNIIHSYTQRKTRGFFSWTVPSFLPSPLLFTSHQTNALTMNSHLLFIFGGVKCTPGIPLSTPHLTHSTPNVHFICEVDLRKEITQSSRSEKEGGRHGRLAVRDLVLVVRIWYMFFFFFQVFWALRCNMVIIFTQAMRKVSFKKPKETKNHNKIVALLPIFTTSLSKLSFCAENFF